MRYEFLFVCAFCLFNAITAVIQDKKIDKMQNIIEALRHEIQTTQQLIYALKDDKQKDKAN